MSRKRFRRAFTLLEINLAIFVMSTGVLSVCILYALGFRENRQSVEDVGGISCADAYLAPLVQGLSATNLPWSSWVAIGDEPSQNATKSHEVAEGLWPANGWSAYVTPDMSRDQKEAHYRVNSGVNGIADGVFGKVLGKVPAPYKGSKPNIQGNWYYGLVASRRGAVIQLSFKAARRLQSLMTVPTVVAEVHFQGDPEK